MKLVEQARLISQNLAFEKEKKRLEAEKNQKEWDIAHAADMVESMKPELKAAVLDAAKEGNAEAKIIIYSYCKSKPTWVRLFRDEFDQYLKDEEFQFVFSDLPDMSGKDCVM